MRRSNSPASAPGAPFDGRWKLAKWRFELVDGCDRKSIAHCAVVTAIGGGIDRNIRRLAERGRVVLPVKRFLSFHRNGQALSKISGRFRKPVLAFPPAGYVRRRKPGISSVAIDPIGRHNMRIKPVFVDKPGVVLCRGAARQLEHLLDPREKRRYVHARCVLALHTVKAETQSLTAVEKTCRPSLHYGFKALRLTHRMDSVVDGNTHILLLAAKTAEPSELRNTLCA